LVVFDALELLLNQFICKKCEEKTLHERKDAHDEYVGIPWLVHVEFRFGAGKQLVEAYAHQQRKVDCGNARIAAKLHKVLQIAVPDTVVDPRTMVVHFKHTEPTFTAVVRAGRFPGLWAFALLTDEHLIILRFERCLHSFRYPPWIDRGSSLMRNNC